METISIKQARRLALIKAGLLKPELIGLPGKAAGSGKRARDGCHRIIGHFGYLQLDTVSVAGARTHAIVLASRLKGLNAAIVETLLKPECELFEYWGHEACWLPIQLYPYFEFRRKEFTVHPWWGPILHENKKLAHDLVKRIQMEGPLRSLDLEGASGQGWWDIKLAKRVAEALWSCGRLAIRERRNFQRVFDLTENVIPETHRKSVSVKDSLDTLSLIALKTHGWATDGTINATWRFKNRSGQCKASKRRLAESGEVIACTLHTDERNIVGWITPDDLELANQSDDFRPRKDTGVLLSPFDPVLWDRQRVQILFDFEQKIEIYKPAAQRKFGYYCLPILSGERLIGRVDLKADRKAEMLRVVSLHFENTQASMAEKHAADVALDRYACSVGLTLVR